MTLTQARATYGLNCRAVPTTPGASGSAQLGPNTATLNLPDADIVYSLRCIFAGNGDDLVLDMLGGTTVGSTAWVAGNAQVETNTIVAAAGCTSNGNMTLVITSAGMSGSPLNVVVALTTTAHTTAALIAAAARAALTANSVIAARFTIGGTGADIVLTRKPTHTYTVGSQTVNIYPADDATLNINIPAGLGVTVSAISTNTTSGVATDGCYIVDNNTDFEGNYLSAMVRIYGVLYQATGDFVTADTTFSVPRGGFAFFATPETSAGMNVTTSHVANGSADLIITVFGSDS